MTWESVLGKLVYALSVSTDDAHNEAHSALYDYILTQPPISDLGKFASAVMWADKNDSFYARLMFILRLLTPTIYSEIQIEEHLGGFFNWQHNPHNSKIMPHYTSIMAALMRHVQNMPEEERIGYINQNVPARF